MTLSDLLAQRDILMTRITEHEEGAKRLRAELAPLLGEIDRIRSTPQIKPMDRKDALAIVRRLVERAFPGAKIQTNDDMNIMTPMSVSIELLNGSRKAHRASTVNADPEAFAHEAIEKLRRWYDSRRAGVVEAP